MREAQRATLNGFHWNLLISVGKEGSMTALKVICQIDDESEDRHITVVSRIGSIIVSIKQLIAFICFGGRWCKRVSFREGVEVVHL